LESIIVWKTVQLSHNTVGAGCETASSASAEFHRLRFGNRARQMIRIEKKPTPKDAKDL